MRLIRSNKKNAKKLFNAKARVESQKQTQTESEEIDETTREDPSSQKASRRIYVQTLQAFGQIR